MQQRGNDEMKRVKGCQLPGFFTTEKNTQSVNEPKINWFGDEASDIIIK
jgi:sulfur transfer protein SufE